MRNTTPAALLLAIFVTSGAPARGQTHSGKRAPAATLRGPAASLSKPDRAVERRRLQRYGNLPLSFEANQGQSDSRVKFVSRAGGYTLFLTGNEAVLAFRAGRRSSVAGDPAEAKLEAGKPMLKPGAPRSVRTVPDRSDSGPTLRMTLLGANGNAQVTGVDQLRGKSDYFIGNDPHRWRTNVPNYAKVKYESVYPGVDLVYYGNRGQLEYDFVVAPGAHPDAIRLGFGVCPPRGSRPGARYSLGLAANGDLVVYLAGGQVRFHKPVVYQPAAAAPGSPAAISPLRVLHSLPVETRYRITGRNQVGFQVGDYDRTKPLVIDPSLVYSTYLGGSGDDYGESVAVDSAGNAYVAGQTCSTNFPVYNPYEGSNAGDCDAFITKLNPSGSALIYSTYYGGSGNDIANGIALDASNNVYLVGQTYSPDFPITSGAFQSVCGGDDCAAGDVFVAELNATGSALIYSTYLGGSAYDQGNAIALDAADDAYVTGTTCSSDFPVTPGSFQTTYGGDDHKCAQLGGSPSGDGFVAELNPSGSSLAYSTFLGGSNGDTSYAIALDSSDNAYIAGFTFSSDFPTTPGAFQTGLGTSAPTAGWLTKLNSDGSTLIYSTYLGGSGEGGPCDACATGVAVNSAGDAFVSGVTLEKNFPTTPGAYQTTLTGSGHDAFLTEFNAAGSALLYSTFIGGSSDDGAVALALTSTGLVCLRGNTSSKDFPTTQNAFQTVYGGMKDIFVSLLNPTPNKPLVYSTYLGGSGWDYGFATSNVKSSGQGIYVTGYSGSTNFPVSTGAFQASFGGGTSDGFASKLNPNIGPKAGSVVRP